MPAPPGRIIGRGAWHLEEDEALKAAVKIHGSKSWATVSTVRQTHCPNLARDPGLRAPRTPRAAVAVRPPASAPQSTGRSTSAFSLRLAARFPRAAAAPRAPPVFPRGSADPVPLRAAQLVPGRTGKQCRERWTSKVRPPPNRFRETARLARRLTRPFLSRTQLDMNVKREPWSKAEDARLIASQAKSAAPPHLSSAR